MKDKTERMFHSLRQQLVYEISFVTGVSRPYRDPHKQLDIVDFKYRGESYKLIFNGKITLETHGDEILIDSYDDLVHGLIKSMSSGRKSVA